MKRVDLEEKNQLFEKSCKELEAQERQIDFAKSELESKQKQLDDRIRELELKEKQFANIIQVRVGADQSERNSPSLDLGFLVTMFGKGLQLFLNEHVKYHDSIAGKVLQALKQCIDPAKLVLDAMEGFYPPHLKKGNFEFGGSVVRRSCILLLEQIMKISPPIHTDVKEAALGIAAEWKVKMKPVVENWLEVLGFLSLLAAYELGGDFDADELLSLYKIVPQHRQTLEIFMLLGFTDEIDGATSNQRKRYMNISQCYDSARSAAREPRLQKNIPNVSTFQFGSLNHHQSTQPYLANGSQSFWTCCPYCTIKYKYYKDFVNRSLRCQNCSKPFIAYDLGAQGAPPVSNQANTGSNRGQPQESQQKQAPTQFCKLGARSSGQFRSYHLRSEANSSRKVGSEHVTRTGGTAEVGRGLKNKVKGIAHVNTKERNTEVGISKVDAAKTRESMTSRGEKRKRGRPPKRSHENTVEFNRKAVTLDSGAKKYNVIDDSESKPNLGSTSDPKVYECPDPEFSDFDKDKVEKCFSVDQIWACYDKIDGMPRFYAQVKKVFSHASKLQITWLEADPEEQGEINWVNEGLPVGCGKFTRGDTEETSNCLTFSHLIHFEKGIGRGSYVIYPIRGETWALFKDWDIGWSSDSENHKKYIFEIVEILSDFSHDTGIKIGYLAKIEGFVSLFQRTTRGGFGSCLIPSSELLRFSHRIPSFKMTGAEREGVPEGSFELDPAALPTNPKELWQPEEKEKVETQSMNVNVNGSSSISSDVKVKSTIGSENTSTPKKCVDFEGKNYFNKEVAKLRRSPWELNSTIKKSVCAYSVPCESGRNCQTSKWLEKSNW